MKSLQQYNAAQKALGALVVVYIIVRVVGFLSVDDVIVWPDSEDYATISTYESLSKSLWFAHRPPVYPYFLKSFTARKPIGNEPPPLLDDALGLTPKVAIGRGLAGDPEFIRTLASVNVMAVATVQFVVSVFSWLVFALVASKGLKSAGLRVATIALLLLVGTDLNVTLWDRHILTESLSISLFLLLASALIAYLRSPRPELLLLSVLIAIVYGGLKGTHPYVLVAFAATIAIIPPIVAWEKWRPGLSLGTCAVMLLAIAAVNIYSAERGYRGVIPFTNVLNARITADGYEDVYDYLRAAGMPPVPDSFFEKLWFAPFAEEPALHEWVVEEGPAAYRRFLLQNPRYLFGRPFATPESTYNLPVYNYYDSYLANYGLPGAFGPNLVFRKSSFWIFLLAAASIALLVVRRRRQIIAVETLFHSAMLGIAVLLSLLVWHADLIENSRHMMQVTVQLRLSLILLSAYLISSYFADPTADLRQAGSD